MFTACCSNSGYNSSMFSIQLQVRTLLSLRKSTHGFMYEDVTS